jgi:hypothetical protein
MADAFRVLLDYLEDMKRHDSRPSDPMLINCLLELNNRVMDIERRQDQRDELAMEGNNG